MVERRVRDAKAAGSNPVAPTFFRNEPFGENVEGLSHCGDKSYVVEHAVQKHGFEDAALRGVVGGKPLATKGLRKFKNFRRQLGVFVVGAVLEDVVDGASRERRLRLPPDASLGVNLLDHAINGQVLVRVEMEDALDVGSIRF